MTKYFYSGSTNGFYIEGLHKTMPSDVKSITAARYDALLNELSQGLTLYSDNGLPKTREPVNVITWDDIRANRDYLLSKSDWTQLPDANLTDEMKTAWTVYRQQLRDITTTFSTPESVEWPDTPSS